MKTGINLVITKQETHKQIRKVLMGALIFFGITFVLTAAAIGYNIYLNKQYEDLSTQQQQLTDKINAQKEKRLAILQLHDRISAIDKLLKGRVGVSSRFSDINDLFPEDFIIEGIDVGTSKIVLLVSSDNLASFNQIFNTFFEIDKDKDLKKKLAMLKKVGIITFNREEKATAYQANLEFTY